MKIIQKLKSPLLTRAIDNWREIVLFLIIGLGFSVIADLLISLSAGAGWAVGSVATVTNYLQGFSRFIAVCLCATFLGMTLWPTVARFAEVNFKQVYDNAFTPKEKIVTFIAVVSVLLITAAICFNP